MEIQLELAGFILLVVVAESIKRFYGFLVVALCCCCCCCCSDGTILEEALDGSLCTFILATCTVACNNSQWYYYSSIYKYTTLCIYLYVVLVLALTTVTRDCDHLWVHAEGD